MIFIARDVMTSWDFRYELYHEHLEGLYLLGAVGEDLKKKFLDSVRHLDDIETGFKKKLEGALERSKEKGHFFALVMELVLAKKEMSEDQFSRHLTYAITNRIG